MSESFDFVKNYWDYYYQLEQQFLVTKKYVAFSSYNKSTYSLEYLELLQAVCSEIDVVAKIICKKFDSSFDVKKARINNWYYVLQDNLDLENAVVNCDAFDSEYNSIRPWKGCRYEIKTSITKNGVKRRNIDLVEGKATPEWWKAYNKAKHSRTDTDGEKPNFTRANLENVLYAFAALYSLEQKYLKLIRKTGDGEHLSDLFYIGRRPFALLGN